ncbi:MAG: hypothetical protein AB7T10_04850 [bacterium]
MKRLLTLFLVIGVVEMYGQTIEGELQTETQAETDTIQQADTITLPDTIDVEKKLQTSDFELTEDSSIIKQNENDELKRKNNEIYCCCMLDWRGFQKRQNQDSSAYSIGYTLNVYPRVFYSLYDGRTFLGADQDGYLFAGNPFCLFHKIEVSHNMNLLNKILFKIGYNYEYSNSIDKVADVYVKSSNLEYSLRYYNGLNLFTFHSLGINMYKEFGCFRMGLSNGITYMKQEFYAVYLSDDEWYDIDVNRFHYQIGMNAGINYTVSNHVTLNFGMEYKKYFQMASYVNYPNIIYDVSKINPGMVMHYITLTFNF